LLSYELPGGPTVCVTCVWAGVDKVWEQEKLEARKMLDCPKNVATIGRGSSPLRPPFIQLDWIAHPNA
jgi:hypothetical protein